MRLAVADSCNQLLQIAWFLPSKLKVAGSNPAGVAIDFRYLALSN
jgi:hypothetical protein